MTGKTRKKETQSGSQAGQRTKNRAARLKFLAIAMVAVTLPGLSLAAPNLVVDPSFEQPTNLHAFYRSPGDPWIPGEWNAEEAQVLAGDTPDGDQLLRVDQTAGGASQVNQIIDLNGLAVDDCCPRVATFSILVNAPQATTVTLILAAGTGQTNVGTLTGRTAESVSVTTDGDPATWELLEGVRSVPITAAFLELQMSAGNAQISSSGVWFDQASVSLETTLVVDGGFEEGTALHSFYRGAQDPPWMPGEWNVENADIVSIDSGTGITPRSGTQMLRMNMTGGVLSQANQILEVASPISTIGETLTSWSVCLNAAASTPVSLRMRTGDGQSTGNGVLTNMTTEIVTLQTDDDPDTWEILSGERFLPPSTAFLELQLSVPNAEMPSDGLFVDCARVSRSVNRLTDAGFEPHTTLHSFFRGSSDPPWMPGEWNVEDAEVVDVPTSGVNALGGAGMLRIDSTAGVLSQVNQIVSVPSLFRGGDATVKFGVHVNSTIATTVRLIVRAGDGQSSNGNLTNPTTLSLEFPGDGRTDADVSTWELLEGALQLPENTAFVELQVAANNSEIPSTGVFVDLGRVTFGRCPQATASSSLTGPGGGSAETHLHVQRNVSNVLNQGGEMSSSRSADSRRPAQKRVVRSSAPVPHENGISP